MIDFSVLDLAALPREAVVGGFPDGMERVEHKAGVMVNKAYALQVGGG